MWYNTLHIVRIKIYIHNIYETEQLVERLHSHIRDQNLKNNSKGYSETSDETGTTQRENLRISLCKCATKSSKKPEEKE